MAGIEITLVIIGLILMIGSFFLQEKLSPKDIESITDLSEKELKMIVEKQLKNANTKVEDSIEQMMDEALGISERAMEKESNEKIMAISEYSNTVLESMNKTHNEILFLYSMLGDKHTELTSLASQLQQFSDQMKSTESEMLRNLAEAAKEVEQKVAESDPMDEDSMLRASVEVEHEQEEYGEDGVNHNERILFLHQQGVSDVEIARDLGLGLGEVKLVIGLFKGEEYSEV
jgi:hypothetical protein